MRKLIIIVLVILLQLTYSNNVATAGSGLKLGISFPPVKNNKQRAFTAKHLKNLNVDRIRIGLNWRYCEPVKGKFHWNSFDAIMAFVKENNLSLLLTIQATGPDWACGEVRNDRSCVYKNLGDFKQFVEALLKRYPNVIDKIQYGNEWPSRYWYAGDIEDFVKCTNILYSAVKKLSPKTVVVLGGLSIGQLRAIAACEGNIDSFFDDSGGFANKEDIIRLCSSKKVSDSMQRVNYGLQYANYDMVDIHLYDDPEKWSIYYAAVKSKIKHKPIIISEFGGPNILTENYSDEYQAERLKKYIETIESLGISEAYYFKLIEKGGNSAHAKSGLLSGYPSLKEKPGYEVFKQYNTKP